MNKIIQTISRNSKKQIMLIIELFFSFIALFLALAFVFRIIDNTKDPLCFEYKNVCKLSLNAIGDNPDSIPKIMEYINSDNNVEGTGSIYSTQIFGNGFMDPAKPIKSEGKEIPANKIEFMLASDEIARLFNIHLIEGRWFNSTDNASKNPPVVINKKLKDFIFGNKSASGKTIEYLEQKCTVIGVCANIKHKGEYEQTDSIFILRRVDDITNVQYNTNYSMNGSNCGYDVYVKFKNTSSTKLYELSKRVTIKFPGYSVQFIPIEKYHQKYKERTWGPLIISLAVFLFLFINVLFGLFGILWYNISLRQPEIGIRMATGANKTRIFKQFIWEIVALTSLGIIPGIIVAIQFPILKIFDIDSLVYFYALSAAAAVIYLLVILCALFPTFQATKIQPALALHEQ
jgi:putative ABC transport system permease protein